LFKGVFAASSHERVHLYPCGDVGLADVQPCVWIVEVADQWLVDELDPVAVELGEGDPQVGALGKRANIDHVALRDRRSDLVLALDE